MSGGISPNKLNGISKAYLDMVTDINKKGQEDDVNRWTQKEETACKKESPFKKKKYKEDWQPEIEHSKLGDAKKKADKKRESKLPPHLRGDAIGKMKKAFANEGYSDWRTSLREVTSDAEATDIDNQPEIKEKKVKNKIKINPSFLEAVKEMGGELLEVKELDDTDAAKDEKASQKEKRLKLRLLRTKMMAVKQGADDSIVAGYEPKGEMVEGAVATIKKVTKAGVKRHKKAVEDKKIKDRKAVPYAALAAEHQPEGEVVAEESKRTTKGRWVDKKGRSHKFAVTTHTGDEVHVSSIVKAQYPAKRVVITGQSADKKKKDVKKKVKEETTFKRASRMVSEDRDQAFKNVVARLQKKHGKDSVITKDNPPKPPTEAQKKAYAAHKAKIAAQDTRDELEKSSDGRYSLRHSNRGSD